MKKIQDERLTRASHAILARCLWVLLASQAYVLAVKLLLGAALRLCVLDIAVLAVGVIGLVGFRSVKGLWGRKDEVLREIDDAGLSRVFTALLWLMLIGEFLLVFFDKTNILWYAPSILVWFIPAVVYLVQALRSGLVLWGNREQQEQGPRRLLRNTAVASVFFGVLTRGSSCFENGAFRPEGLIEVVAMGATWGVLFYGMMRFLVERGQKKADAQVAQAEAADEE